MFIFMNMVNVQKFCTPVSDKMAYANSAGEQESVQNFRTFNYCKETWQITIENLSLTTSCPK